MMIYDDNFVFSIELSDALFDYFAKCSLMVLHVWYRQALQMRHAYMLA